jgi:nucleotide-binding universal stress UspA family protein
MMPAPLQFAVKIASETEREIILGGATRKILQQMTVPVFISH